MLVDVGFQPTSPNISFVPWLVKRSATMLDPFAQLFQRCLGHAHSLHIVYKDLWVVSFPRCIAGPNIVGSCCIHLHTTANMHATTPNIFGATMLGVVASVWVQPDIRSLYVSGKLPTYPSPRPKLTLTSHLVKNVGLEEGKGAVSQKLIMICLFF